MRHFLDDYIPSLSSDQQRRAAFLLEEAKLQKADVNKLAEQLASITAVSAAVSARHTAGRLVTYDVFDSNFRSIDGRLRALYSLSNKLAQLLYANIDMLTSQVFQLENEITSLEKIANNYGFVTSQGATYHRSFMEPFDSEINREELNAFAIPDRSGVPFGPGEMANLRTAQGVLSLSGGGGADIQNVPLTASIVDSNVTGLVQQSTDVNLTTTPHITDGWRMVVTSPVHIDNANSADERYQGAWVKVEFMASTPSPASEIRITPLGSSALDLMAVNLYESEATSDFRSVLPKVMTLDRPVIVHFPTQLVHKFQIIVNQSIYTRIADVKTDVYKQELIYNKLITTTNPPTATKKKRKSVIHNLHSWKKSYKRHRSQQNVRIGMMNGKSHASAQGAAMATEHANIEFPTGFFGSYYGPMNVRDLNRSDQGGEGVLWFANEDVVGHAFISQMKDTAVYRYLMNSDSYTGKY